MPDGDQAVAERQYLVDHAAELVAVMEHERLETLPPLSGTNRKAVGEVKMTSSV